jgi:RNA polymerase sigma-70 factor, ECF subfamily
VLADDLVQDAVLRALSHSHQFTAGTNFRRGSATILRNSYFNEMRRRRRAAQMSIDVIGNTAGVSGGQMERLQTRDFKRAFSLLAAQRWRWSRPVASSLRRPPRVVSCAVGTMKGRVSRARAQLQQMLNGKNHPAMPPQHPAEAAPRLVTNGVPSVDGSPKASRYMHLGANFSEGFPP